MPSSAGVPNSTTLPAMLHFCITCFVAKAADMDAIAMRLCPQACPIPGRASRTQRMSVLYRTSEQSGRLPATAGYMLCIRANSPYSALKLTTSPSTTSVSLVFLLSKTAIKAVSTPQALSSTCQPSNSLKNFTSNAKALYSL